MRGNRAKGQQCTTEASGEVQTDHGQGVKKYTEIRSQASRLNNRWEAGSICPVRKPLINFPLQQEPVV